MSATSLFAGDHRLVALIVGALAIALGATMWLGPPSSAKHRTGHREADAVATKKTDWTEASGVVCATSDRYVNVPGLTTTFTLGGTKRQPALVLFSATVGGTGDEDFMVVRLLVDGVVQPGNGQQTTVSYPDGPARAAAFHFMTAPLRPGRHTVKLQYAATAGAGGPWRTCMSSRNLAVLHG